MSSNIEEHRAKEILKEVLRLSKIEKYKSEEKELKIRLDEALKLLDNKDKELDRMRLAMGEMELQIGDLQNQKQKQKRPPSSSIKDIEEKEQWQIKYEELKIAYEELKAVETLRVKQQDFNTASRIQSAPKVWVAAINALNLYRGLNEGSRYAIEHNDPWKKVLFDVADNGQLKNARLEHAAS